MTTLVEQKPMSATGSGGTGWAESTDEDLLLEYHDHHDPEAFEELVHRYEREVFSYLRRFLGDAEMADDAFQGTFLQVHLKCDQFQPGRRFRPWLYTIATHQAIDLQRRNRRHRNVSLDSHGTSTGDDHVGPLVDLLEGSEEAPLANLQRDEQQRWVRQSVAELPATLRSAVVLVYYQGLKYREAAEILSIPVGTVKSRLHSALLKLTQAWQKATPK